MTAASPGAQSPGSRAKAQRQTDRPVMRWAGLPFALPDVPERPA